MTGSAGQKRVPVEYFANSPFPLPPLVELHRIVAKVNEHMVLCDRLEASLAGGNDARRCLLEALLHVTLKQSKKVSGSKIPAIAENASAS